MESGKKLKQMLNPMVGSGNTTTCQRSPEIKFRAGMKSPNVMPTKTTRDWSRMMIEVSRSTFQVIEPRKNRPASSE